MPPVFGPDRRRRRACGPAPWRAAAPSCRRPARRSSLPRPQELLDHQFGAGIPERATEAGVDRRLSLSPRRGDGHALACGEPVGLDHDGKRLPRQRNLGGRRIGEAGIGRSWMPARAQRSLVKPLSLRAWRRPATAEHLDALPLEIVGEAGDERRFRADDHEADLLLLAEAARPRRDRQYRAPRTPRPRRSRHCQGRNRGYQGAGFA